MSAFATEPVSARVSIFRNRTNQAIRIPKAMSFPDDVAELEITRVGDVISLRPPRKSWTSFAEDAARLQIPDDDPFFAYLEERHDVVEFSRVDFDDEPTT